MQAVTRVNADQAVYGAFFVNEFARAASRLSFQFRSGEAKMREVIISIGFDAAEEPAHCFGVCCELQFGEADAEDASLKITGVRPRAGLPHGLHDRGYYFVSPTP